MYLSLHAGMDFNDTQPFEVTIAAGTTVVMASIPIADDDINERAEAFVVVLEAVSNTTNPVDFSGRFQTTVCRIPRSDGKCHLECRMKCHAWPKFSVMLLLIQMTFSV